MDVVFDIDGTLADATHRLHFIKAPDMPAHDPSEDWRPDWDMFLSDEMVFKDSPIKPVWRMLDLITMNSKTTPLPGHDRILFITGRPQRTYNMTREWLVMHAKSLTCKPERVAEAPIYMRKDGDKRPSHVVKREGLQRARADIYDPQMVFEDRMEDAAMWREEGLICAQVAYGDY